MRCNPNLLSIVFYNIFKLKINRICFRVSNIWLWICRLCICVCVCFFETIAPNLAGECKMHSAHNVVFVPYRFGAWKPILSWRQELECTCFVRNYFVINSPSSTNGWCDVSCECRKNEIPKINCELRIWSTLAKYKWTQNTNYCHFKLTNYNEMLEYLTSSDPKRAQQAAFCCLHPHNFWSAICRR